MSLNFLWICVPRRDVDCHWMGSRPITMLDYSCCTTCSAYKTPHRKWIGYLWRWTGFTALWHCNNGESFIWSLAGFTFKASDGCQLSRWIWLRAANVWPWSRCLCSPTVVQLCLQQRRTREQLVEQGIMPHEFSHRIQGTGFGTKSVPVCLPVCPSLFGPRLTPAWALAIIPWKKSYTLQRPQQQTKLL